MAGPGLQPSISGLTFQWKAFQTPKMNHLEDQNRKKAQQSGRKELSNDANQDEYSLNTEEEN